jgi:ATP-binding cassette subfamily C protein
MRMPSKFFRQFNSGNLAVRAMGLSQIRTVLSRGLATAMLGGIFSFLNFIVMIAYGGWLTLAALVMMILTLAFGLTANIMKIRRLRLAIMAHDDLAGLSVQAIAAIKKLRVAGAENRLASKLISLHNRQRTYDYAARSIENWLRAYNTVIPLFSTAVFFAVVEFLFTDPPATGNFVAFTAAYGSFIVGLTGLLNALTMGLTGFVLYERLRPILETKPEKSIGSLPPGALSGKIEISRVTFRYLNAGRPVLNDVSLTIEPGQFVAIVGPSGSGKSTLLRMLLGFERPHSGSILYDGKDLSRLDVDAVRLQFGAILQNMQVLGGSIFENIAGSRSLTMDDAWRAAELACFDQEIKALPMQMNTVVNDGGTLSGGEKQRLMLARALAGNPKILFMDEATSALDNSTQAVVTKSLSGLDLTRVVIAHRLSTIKDADVIYVMQGGKIIDSGNAETLLESSDLFAAFVERQQIEY